MQLHNIHSLLPLPIRCLSHHQALLTLHGRRLPLTGRPKGVAGSPAIPPLHIAFAAIGGDGDEYFATASDDEEDDEPLLDDEDSEDEEGDDEVDDADLGTMTQM